MMEWYMESDAMGLAIVVAAALVGAVLCWVWMQGRQREALAAAQAAAVQAATQIQIELASTQQRNHALEAEKLAMGAVGDAFKQENMQLRGGLEIIREERTRLDERASKVPSLEGQLAELLTKQQQAQDEILRLSTSEAQKGQAQQDAQTRADATQRTLDQIRLELAGASKVLQEVSEQRTMLQSQADRLPALEEKLEAAERLLVQSHQQNAALREQGGALNAELIGVREAAEQLRSALSTERELRERAVSQAGLLTTEVAQLRMQLDGEREQTQEKLVLLSDAKAALTEQFKNLANEILEDKSKRFTEQNQVNLGLLLDPLKTKISEFQNKVEDVYVKEGKDRSALAEQVRQLMDLNQALSSDAKNLTQALKGSSKAQGSWGELVLERVLEASGLREGEEYVVQGSHTREDGTRALPDVVIHLPQERSLVIDAKVSLTAYEEFSNSDQDAERTSLSKQHMDSMRTHIKNLSEKKYQELYTLNSLDFVLMFVPVEPAFMLAISSDRDIFMDAWRRNVLLVSPSTLLFVVRTVAHLWRQEAQSQNAKEIAKRGAELYDKLVGFVTDMNALGDRLKQAQNEYDDACGKLYRGRGNLVKQADKLLRLGVKPSKVLPVSVLEQMGGEDSAMTMVESAIDVSSLDPA
jgi:DNA recombination protein RmuC